MIAWIIFTGMGAICYRLGGKEGFRTWIRDWGVSLVFVAYLGYLGAINGFWTGISLLPCFLGLAGALTTYRYFLPKPKDYEWYHYALHGFFTSFSAICYAWASGHWLGFLIRVGICTVFMALWSIWTSWDDLEEGGRGVVLIGTIPLLLI